MVSWLSQGVCLLLLQMCTAGALQESPELDDLSSQQHVLLPGDAYAAEYRSLQDFISSDEIEQIPSSQPPPSRAGSWLGWGGSVYNNHWAGSDSTIDASNVEGLIEVCAKKYSPGVSAAPLIEDGIAYYPTWSGLLVALDYRTCHVLWRTNVTRLIQEFRPLKPEQAFLAMVSRATPTVDGDTLFVGTLAQALLMALDKRTGRLIDALQLGTHPFAVLTQSPTFYNGRIFVGVSSLEEAAGDVVPGYECCSFVGSMNAVALKHGRLRLLWTTPTIADGTGLVGAAVWGGQPAIDPIRDQVFVGTGNMYMLPEAFEECHNATVNLTVVGDGQVGAQCLPTGVMFDSVIALDIPTGHVNWVQRLGPLDPWNTACAPGLLGPGSGGGPNCNFTAGPDADFGMAPTFILGSEHTPDGLDIVVLGQKNSALWALSAQAGKVQWMTQTGPSGLEGGLIWGVAADDRQVYYTVVNSNRANYTLPAGDGKTITSNSAFGAASLKDGEISWQIPSPRNTSSIIVPAVVNDVVLTGITGNFSEGTSAGKGPGSFLALDKNTGEILKEWPLDAYFHGVVSVVHDYVMFGSGYGGIEAPAAGTFQVWRLNGSTDADAFRDLEEPTEGSI